MTKKEEGIDVKDLLYHFLSNWRVFVFSIVVCLAVACIYIYYAMPTYRVTASVMVRDEKRGGDYITELTVFEDINALAKSATDNEVEILRSKSLARRTVTELGLYKSYMGHSGFRKYDLYGRSPIVLNDSLFLVNEVTQPYIIRIDLSDPEEMDLTLHCGEVQLVDTTFSSFPLLLHTNLGPLELVKEYDCESDECEEISIKLEAPISAARAYSNNLTVMPFSKTTSVINLKLVTTNKETGVKFLDGLISIYNRMAIDEKNESAMKTAIFIEERIKMLQDELGITEKDLEDYKRKEGLTDVFSNADLSLAKSAEYEQKRVDNETQLKLVLFLKEYLNSEQNRGMVIPSNVGLTDKGLIEQINLYNKMLLERNRLMQTTSENNPVVVQLTNQINGLYDNVMTLVDNVESGLKISQEDLKLQLDKYRGKIYNVPTQQRLFEEIERQRHIQQQLFLMLLQKREENALAMAATVNKAKIVDESIADSVPIAPKKSIILFFALMIALAIAVVFVLIKRYFSIYIKNANTIEKENLTTLPMVAEVPYFSEVYIPNQNLDTLRKEVFRMLRTNIQFVLKEKENKVILFSSYSSGEGKTYITANTAISFASLGKKVIAIGADIRNPHLKDFFCDEVKVGLSNFLANTDLSCDDVILSTEYDNLDVIPSGPVPPNPTELLSLSRLDEMMDYLRSKYDYILIDSAPLSLVSDTLVLARVADMSAIVFRANYSNKHWFKSINNWVEEGRLPNSALILNGLYEEKFLQRIYASYGYGYGKYEYRYH